MGQQQGLVFGLIRLCLGLCLCLACNKKTDTTNRKLNNENEIKAAEIYQKADSLIQIDKLPEALMLLDKVVQLDTNKALYYLDRGAVKIRLFLYTESLPDLNKALQKEPNNVKVLINIAIAENNLALEKNQPEHLDTAINYADRALQLNPNFGFAYFVRGESYLFKNDTSRLCDNLAQALKNNFKEAMPRFLKYCK